MNALHPTHTILVEGYCTHCGQDLAGAGVYADQLGAEVDCPFCGNTLAPDEIKEERTHEQELLWALVASANRDEEQARREAEEAKARLAESRRQNDLLRMKANRLQDVYDEVTRA
tara:strand:+ start:247 stop:591 length:345 start_codon:yes stop_codon:yes gene_type:complete